jgi:alkanesulfonate monooxygenase SsuD/methylene tetrahydromethanopterin reductase-like flavin-dependent oxidoreductase (luciferase family)
VADSKVTFGIHLPVRALPGGDQTPPTVELLSEIVDTANASGFKSIWVTDHIVWFNPWIDCLAALAAVAGKASQTGMSIATGVIGLPLRHPVAIAQTFATLDVLSAGNLIVGVGEGSTKSDFDALGLPFDERRKMLEDGAVALRKLLTDTHVSHDGPYYKFEDVTIAPHSIQQPSPPIWLSSWGAPAGVRRVARLADGWIASGWHATPDEFADGLGRLKGALPDEGKDPESFPNAVNTIFFYVDEDRARAHRNMGLMVEKVMGQPFDSQSGHHLVGDPAECRELVHKWMEAGAKTIAVWPLVDPVKQTELFGEHVIGRL